MRIKTENIVRTVEDLEDFFKVRPDTREFLTDILSKTKNNVCDLEYNIGAHIDDDGTIAGCLWGKKISGAEVYIVTEHKEKPSVAILIKEITDGNKDIVAYISCENIYCIEKIYMFRFVGDTSYAWKYLYEEFESKIECLLEAA